MVGITLVGMMLVGIKLVGIKYGNRISGSTTETLHVLAKNNQIIRHISKVELCIVIATCLARYYHVVQNKLCACYLFFSLLQQSSVT